MLGLEIVLIVAGTILVVVSFVIPVRSEEASQDMQNIIRDEVKKQVGTEVDGLRAHVDGVVDEAVEYAQEKTERSLERLTNEKIMAVNEYSDTVLGEIHKNHEEVMFLYDMLSDKQQSLKDAVAEANQVEKKVQESTREAESMAENVNESVLAATAFQETNAANYGIPAATTAAAQAAAQATDEAFSTLSLLNDFRDLQVESLSPEDAHILESGELDAIRVPLSNPAVAAPQKVRTLNWAAMAEAEAEQFDPTFPPIEGEDDNPQSELHQKILTLREMGEDSVSIARLLNMGVGEVELIIGLHGSKEE